MTRYPDLLILRHGETEWNVAGRLQGAKDSPLTAMGRAQAQRQGEILRRFGIDGWVWFTSPQGRAMATAALAGGGRAAEADARLVEITLGDWTGRARDEIAAAVPHLFENDDLIWYDHAPGGEGLAALARRTRAFLDDLTTPAVVVTHGITSRVLRCHATGRDWSEFAQVEGGQGVVYHIAGGVQARLE